MSDEPRQGVAETPASVAANKPEGAVARAGAFKRVTEFLGLKRSIVGLLSMVVLVGLGEHMAEQFLPIYLLALGAGFVSVGFLNGMDNLLGALYSFPGGYLSDRLGTKRALLVFNLVAMVGFVIVIAIPTWWAVLIGAVFFLSWTAISLPATMGLVAKVLPKNKRTMGVSVHSLVRRVPMALGPIVGGIFVDQFGKVTGVRLAFVCALAMALVALVAQQWLIEDDRKKAADAPAGERNPFKIFKLMSPSLKSSSSPTSSCASASRYPTPSSSSGRWRPSPIP